MTPNPKGPDMKDVELAGLAHGAFVEAKCTVGGTLCPAWNDWFQACDETDPDALAQDRDPTPLVNWPFDPVGCERPDICPLYRAHTQGV